MATLSRSWWRALAFSGAVLFIGLGGSAAFADDPQHDSGAGSTDETQTEGQVIGINTLAPRPFVQIGNVDGTVALYFADPTAIATSAVHYGDYISIIGQKVNENEYLVETVRVDVRAPVNNSPSLVGTGSTTEPIDPSVITDPSVLTDPSVSTVDGSTDDIVDDSDTYPVEDTFTPTQTVGR